MTDQVVVVDVPFPENPGDGIVIEKDGTWWAIWRDHANRVIKARLGDEMTQEVATVRAFEAVERYVSDIRIRNEVVDKLSDETIRDMAERAVFPREVVARFIDATCRRLARDAGQPTDGEKTAGIQLFVDRTKNVGNGKGIPAREVQRILTEEDRITVDTSLVDIICVEFDIPYSDFVESALDWSGLVGQWSERPGERDPWPYGYKLQNASAKDEIL